MGTLIGHVLPGIAFILLGLWHLFNHTKLHAKNPKTYKSLAWFPTPKLKYIELYFIMMSSSTSILMELIVAPKRHTPFDPDGTIPSTHLHNFEHALISMTMLVYASFALVLDRFKAKAQYGLTLFLASLVFFQEFLLFRLHSTDHKGLEWQFHLLLQVIIFVSLVTTLLGIGYPDSFLVSFTRSSSIYFQGVWFNVIGFMLYLQDLLPRGCYLHDKNDHEVVDCDGEESLYRAKSLVNIQFSFYLIVNTIFVMSFYLALVQIYGGESDHYSSLKTKEDTLDDDEDLELQKNYLSNKVEDNLSIGLSGLHPDLNGPEFDTSAVHNSVFDKTKLEQQPHLTDFVHTGNCIHQSESEKEK